MLSVSNASDRVLKSDGKSALLQQHLVKQLIEKLYEKSHISTLIHPIGQEYAARRAPEKRNFEGVNDYLENRNRGQ